jgi:hypothetical protein
VELWDRQPAESDQAWRAFVAYRDAGLHRRYQDSGLPFADTAKLATTHEWAKRTRAYDAWADQIAQEAYRHALEQAATQRASQQAEIVSMGLTVSVNGIRALLLRQAESPTAEILQPTALIRLADMSIKAAQLLEGKPTDNLRISLADLSPEEIAILRRK